MEKIKKKATGWDARGRGELRKYFEFYALLATLSHLRLWRVRLREGPRYAPTTVTALTALSIHLFKVKTSSVAFLRVLQRAFWPKLFIMLISFIFSYSEDFFVLLYPTCLFHSGEMPARATRTQGSSTGGLE